MDKKVTVIGSGHVGQLLPKGLQKKNYAMWCWWTSLKVFLKEKHWIYPKQLR
jgi:hypothetical protein